MAQAAFERMTRRRSRERGSCLMGCLVFALFTVVVVAVVGFVIHRFVTNVVETYTDAEPIELPVVEATPDVRDVGTGLADLDRSK